MDDLVQFLRDRLDEDERTARAATPGAWSTRNLGRHDLSVVVQGPSVLAQTDSSRGAADGLHIARHDPARVLAEVDAHRRLLDDCLRQGHERNEEDNWYSCSALRDDSGELLCTNDSRAGDPCDCGRDRTVERRIRLLALPYAAHPDYREEWRPSNS